MKKLRRTVIGLILLVITAVLANPVAAQNYPEVIPLPNGFQPEGIVVGEGNTAYAGSLANGDIYAADLESGEGHIAIEGPGTPAVGLDYDRRTGYLFVSGGPNGDGRIYNTHTGELVAAYDFGGGFVNDVIVTPHAAYFTDSFAPNLYSVALDGAGEPGAHTTIPLSGEFVFVPGGFNTNGIVATPNGNGLIIVHSSRGELYFVNPQTGEAALIDLGGDNVNSGDGLLLLDRTLFVVQNSLNQIAQFQLNRNYSAARLQQLITDDDFDVPTTVSNQGTRLYAVNARFGTTPGPDVEYDIVRVSP
ncbi:MAG: superoxide dismutase [Ardenticatenaceae bacterium]|nr:superoxide dismutase [Ardenticatenaceae bacterium]